MCYYMCDGILIAVSFLLFYFAPSLILFPISNYDADFYDGVGWRRRRDLTFKLIQPSFIMHKVSSNQSLFSQIIYMQPRFKKGVL